MQIRRFQNTDAKALVELWQACNLTRAWNDPYKDIVRKCAQQPELFAVGVDIENRIIASAMFGYDGHRGWVNYLAVHPDFQRRGYASELMNWGEAQLKNLGCPKLNLQVRSDNADVIAFYEKLGYSNDPVVSLGRRLIIDDR